MAHSQINIVDVKALSLYVAATGSQVLKITTTQSTLITDCALLTLESTLQIVQFYLSNIQNNNQFSSSDEVQEQGEDFQTNECIINQNNNFLQNEVILEQNLNESSNSLKNSSAKLEVQQEKVIDQLSKNLSEEQSQGKLPNVQNIYQQKLKIQSEPQNQQFPFSFQLSQIKVDKVKKAAEKNELSKLASTTNHLLLIQKLQKLKIQDMPIFNDLSLQKISQERQASQSDSSWYANYSVGYVATPYYTKESSHLDVDSLISKSESKYEKKLPYGKKFQSFLFEILDPARFCNYTVKNNEIMLMTPKKPRPFCSSTKVPRWAQNLEFVSEQYFEKKYKKQGGIFKRMKIKIQRLSKYFSEETIYMKSNSLQENTAWNILDIKLNNLIKLLDENIEKQKQLKKEVNLQKEIQWGKQYRFICKNFLFLQQFEQEISNSNEKKSQKQQTDNE